MITIKPKTIVHYFHDENEQSVTLRCPSVADYMDCEARSKKNGEIDALKLTTELLITASNGDLTREFLMGLDMSTFTELGSSLAQILPQAKTGDVTPN